MEDRLVPIGKVLRSRGRAGEMVVYPYLDDLTFYRSVREVRLYRENDGIHGYGVESVRIAGDRILLYIEAHDSKDAVQSLIGRELHVPRIELPPLGTRTFYWFDLEGLAVYTEEGDFLGRLEEFFPTGSNEVLVARDGPRETLIPFITEVILGVHSAEGYLRIRAVPGLL